MKDNKSNAKIPPTVYSTIIVGGLVLLVWQGLRSEVPVLRHAAAIIVYLAATGFCGMIVTVQYRFSKEGLHVYWFGIIHRLYPWEKFLVHHVFYLKPTRSPWGNYIVFSTKERLLQTKGTGAFRMPFSTFTFWYTPEMYNKLKRFFPALTNTSESNKIK